LDCQSKLDASFSPENFLYINKTKLSGCMKEDENSRFTRGARNKLQDYLEFAEKLKKVMETESR
jgi:hypothetical protein